MKRLSLQWRITLLTALLIACACVCMNLLLYRTGATGMDALNGFMMQYQPGSADSLTIEIPQAMSSAVSRVMRHCRDKRFIVPLLRSHSLPRCGYGWGRSPAPPAAFCAGQRYVPGWSC